jgi:hypothetical protein
MREAASLYPPWYARAFSRMKSRTCKLFELSAAVAALILWSGCGTPRPPLPPSLELPKPVTDLRGARKGDTVTLVWTVPDKSTDNSKLRHLGPSLICRSLQVAINRCDPVGQVQPSELPSAQPVPVPKNSNQSNGKKNPAPLVQATFNDTLTSFLEQKDPSGFVTYAVETQNANLHSAGLSNQIQIPLAPVLPPPAGLQARVSADGITLTWPGVLPDNQVSGVVYSYRIYRRDKSSKASAIAGEMPLSFSAQPQFLDTGFEWQKTYDYWISVVSQVGGVNSAVQVEGQNSPAVEVFANDIYPPAPPVGLQAVASGVGQSPFVDLTWAPSTEPDLAGYNVYRRQADGPWTKLNDQPVKTPTYRDTTVERGKSYSFSVSAFDPRGNESQRSEEASETVR